MAQPVVDSGSVLCYNGQIYDFPNDTERVFELLVNNKLSELLGVEGGFAFVFYHNGKVLFGRDVLGRRSLCYSLNEAGELVVCSDALDYPNMIECDAGGCVYEFENGKVRTFQAGNYNFQISKQVSGTCDANLLVAALRSAVSDRLQSLPTTETGVSLLFSGGLDCAVLACLLDDMLPPEIQLDLLNVAFENKRAGTLFDTPDRKLARRTFEHLKTRRSATSKPNNRMRLVEIDVPYEVTKKEQPEVELLMRPSATVMDLSIALAFYFASSPQPNCSNFKVIFSGLGADELFGGYSRHSGKANSPDLLADELEIDFKRLPHRNLGRDDRVIANFGREVRYPFLDSRVVDFAVEAPLSAKVSASETKIVLREAARLLDVGAAADEKKRAIQFGARSAKMDPGSGKARGTHAL